MAALFDVGVICENMAANRRYRMTSMWKKKFGTKARGVDFYPFVLRRSATEETVGKSNLGFALSLLSSFARSPQQQQRGAKRQSRL